MSETKLHKAPQRWPLVLIAMDKLVKAGLLVIVSSVLSPRWHDSLLDWVNNAQLGPHNWVVKHILDSIATGLGYSPRKLHLIQIFVIVYAGVYLIEGVGLIFEKKWAEWVVIIATVASLPVEIVDFILRPSWVMVVLFLLNLLMAAYLAWRLQRQALIRRELAQLIAQSPKE